MQLGFACIFTMLQSMRLGMQLGFPSRKPFWPQEHPNFKFQVAATTWIVCTLDLYAFFTCLRACEWASGKLVATRNLLCSLLLVSLCFRRLAASSCRHISTAPLSCEQEAQILRAIASRCARCFCDIGMDSIFWFEEKAPPLQEQGRGTNNILAACSAYKCF